MTITITNEDFRTRTYGLATSGPASGYVALEETKFDIGAKETRTTGARLALPPSTQDGLQFDAIIWLNGCHDYFVRWKVTVADRDRHGCRRVDVVDRPDYVHHWYDHFYDTCVCAPRGKTISLSLQFPLDSAEIQSEAEPVLQRALSALEGDEQLVALVEGHASSEGSEDHNLSLSQRRAEAVASWLIERGVAASRIDWVGKGESEPVADNSTEAGRVRNRRVEITLRELRS